MDFNFKEDLMTITSLPEFLSDNRDDARSKLARVYFTLKNEVCKKCLLNALERSLDGESIRGAMESELNKILDIL